MDMTQYYGRHRSVTLLAYLLVAYLVWLAWSLTDMTWGFHKSYALNKVSVMFFFRHFSQNIHFSHPFASSKAPYLSLEERASRGLACMEDCSLGGVAQINLSGWESVEKSNLICQFCSLFDQWDIKYILIKSWSRFGIPARLLRETPILIDRF